MISHDDTHYTIDGKRYPRLSTVTSVIRKPELENWKMDVGRAEAERIAEETSAYGTRVHDMTALNDRRMWKKLDRLLEAESWLIPHWNAWTDWVKEYVREIIEVELVVWSDRLNVAGRLDRVLEMVGDREPSIGDLKTGSLYPGIGIDLAGYKMMYNEKARRKAKRRFAIHMPRKDPGTLRVKEYGKKEDETAFRSACKLYASMKGG